MTQKPNMKLWGCSNIPENGQLYRYLSMLFIIIIMLIIPAAADTITVCAENCNYTSIQAAIDAAEPGDTILVKSGTYPQNVEVDEQVILKGIDTGGGKPVVYGSGTENVITISEGKVTVDGFEIINSGESLDYAGIYVSSDGNIISNNTIHDNEIGINIYYSRFNNLTSNNVMDNTRGIYLTVSDHNTLRDNLMSSNDYNFGVLAWDVVAMGGGDSTESSDPLISASALALENDIDTSNLVDGKPVYYLIGKSDVVIDSSSNACTVYCIDCENIMIKDLDLSSNYAGVFLYQTAHSTVQNNIINENDWYGLVMYASNNNIVFGNTISGSGLDGIYMTSSTDNNISNNVISSNINGIDIQVSSNNVFTKNTIRENNNFGAKFEYSVRNNTIYHNNFEENIKHAFDEAGENTWNQAYPAGGNYWEEHESPDEKSGAQQDMPGSDGIADSSYIINDLTADKYPFSAPEGWTFHRKMYFHKSLNTTANSVKYIDARDEVNTALEFVTSDDVSGSALSVMKVSEAPPGINQLPDKALNKYVSINADDKLSEKLQWVMLKIYYSREELKSSGLDKSSLHILFYNETAHAWERVSRSGAEADADGYAGYVWANVSHFSYYGIGGSPVPASTQPKKTASGNDGGGGGGGASGEAFENIRITETQRESVFKDREVSYHFGLEGNIVDYINFTALTSSGTIAAKVEILNHTSTLVNVAPPDAVYKNLNIWVGNLGWASSQNIAASTISFKVEKSWISENDIEKTSIKMNRFSEGEWKVLETKRLEEDADYIYYNAETPGFSPFSVTGTEIRKAGGEGIAATPEDAPDEAPGLSQTKEESQTPGFGLFATMVTLLAARQISRASGIF